jgi:hypothetical protein
LVSTRRGLVGLSLTAKRICTPSTALKPIRISLPSPITPPQTPLLGLAREFDLALVGDEVEPVTLDVEKR